MWCARISVMSESEDEGGMYADNVGVFTCACVCVCLCVLVCVESSGEALLDALEGRSEVDVALII